MSNLSEAKQYLHYAGGVADQGFGQVNALCSIACSLIVIAEELQKLNKADNTMKSEKELLETLRTVETDSGSPYYGT